LYGTAQYNGAALRHGAAAALQQSRPGMVPEQVGVARILNPEAPRRATLVRGPAQGMDAARSHRGAATSESQIAIRKTPYWEHSCRRRGVAGLSQRNLIGSCGLGRLEEASMRLPMVSLLALAALFGEIQAALAQSPIRYPWCSKSPRGGSISCRYTSYEQCRTTQSGLGGVCLQSPYYQGMPAKAAVQPRSYRRG
jgi:hypothetical protein